MRPSPLGPAKPMGADPDRVIAVAGAVGTRAERSRLNQEAWTLRPKRPPKSRVNFANLRKPPIPGFGATVRARRLELGMTQVQLAAEVGIVPRRLRYIESGQQGCSWQTARALGQALDLELAAPLPDIVPEPEPMTPTLHDLWKERGQRPQGPERHALASEPVPTVCDLDPRVTDFNAWEQWHTERFGRPPLNEPHRERVERYRAWLAERLGSGAATPEDAADFARQERRAFGRSRRAPAAGRFGWNG